MKQAAALTFDQSIQLLPPEFHSDIQKIGNKARYIIPAGVIAFHQSSPLNGMWRTSHNEDEIRATIDFVLFALGFEGVLLLPKDTIILFLEDNYTSRYSNNRVPIHIIKEGTNYYWIGREGNKMDVTNFFYSNN